MTKVKIDSPGISIELEAEEPMAAVTARALELFHEAGGWPRPRSASTGFASTERRSTAPVQASSMWDAPGPYPVQAGTPADSTGHGP